ncbi:MAG: DNA repair protein RecN [Oligoflexia bacterium]|nr:DNA repair protein RecN [Oligoflexia bacterium]
MLETLKIRNVAIIDAAEISFRAGLNVLSGETGAGKSIVLEAISLLLGGRASTELIRTGCDEAVVEGLFDLSQISWMAPRLEKLGFNAGTPELLIKRTVHRSGKHRIHINGELATVSILQELCEGLIDLCGQHEHQSLTKASVQLELLDRYASLEAQAKGVANAFHRLRELKSEAARLQEAETERSRRADFLKFQIEELRSAALRPGEDDELHSEKHLLQSAEARVAAAESARRILEEEGEGTLNSLRAAVQKMRALRNLDERVTPMLEGLERGIAEVEEVDLALNRYLGSVDLNTERLESVQERLSLIADLRRKYGPTIEAMLASLEQLEAEFAALDKTTERLAELSQAIEGAAAELTRFGKRLSVARRKAAELLSGSVTGELKDLRMSEARFHVELTAKENLEDWTAAGADAIHFLVQTNAGEPPRPLGKIASGGELSRLMLAIRRVIADKGGIGVYLFDEIDAGIGGQTAFQVGKKLKSVAAYNQVLCITHLPQVASFADHHLVVRKTTTGKRTVTEVLELSGKSERKEELARMLGGPQLTRKSLENAAELLELAR